MPSQFTTSYLLAPLALAACVSPAPPPSKGTSSPQEFAAGRQQEDASERIEHARQVHRPGKHHQALSPLEGDWQVRVLGEENAGGDPREIALGRALIRWTMGGLFLRWDVVLEVGTSRHTVTGFLGYDVIQEHYQALWVSELSSSLSLAHGSGSLSGRGIVLQASAPPQRGFVEPRSVLRLLDGDHFTIESIGTKADGEEGVMQQAVYSRIGVATPEE